nr:MAG TPA: hypothetical protein [Caudoviricetes sp.]
MQACAKAVEIGIGNASPSKIITVRRQNENTRRENIRSMDW